MSPVLVTGGSGYLATHLIAALLRDGQAVRTTVRSTAAREQDVRDAVRRGGADDEALTFVEADLSSDHGWAQAVEGCAEIHHVASPFPAGPPDDPAELVEPARDGALRLLRAATAAGARRVVLTSSFAAIGYSAKPVPDFTEADWTDPEHPGLGAYPLSKTVAERAAWDFVAETDGAPELVVANPTFILGPTLVTTLGSSVLLAKMLIEGTMPVVPRQRFGLVDVRDVVDLHRRAMATPGAAGKRYLAVADGPTMTFLELAARIQQLVGTRLDRALPTEADGDEPPRSVIHNDRAKADLGWQPRGVDATLSDTAQSLVDLGLVDGPATT